MSSSSLPSTSTNKNNEEESDWVVVDDDEFKTDTTTERVDDSILKTWTLGELEEQRPADAPMPPPSVVCKCKFVIILKEKIWLYV
jgi:hypothetical protein